MWVFFLLYTMEWAEPHWKSSRNSDISKFGVVPNTKKKKHLPFWKTYCLFKYTHKIIQDELK